MKYNNTKLNKALSILDLSTPYSYKELSVATGVSLATLKRNKETLLSRGVKLELQNRGNINSSKAKKDKKEVSPYEEFNTAKDVIYTDNVTVDVIKLVAAGLIHRKQYKVPVCLDDRGLVLLEKIAVCREPLPKMLEIVDKGLNLPKNKNSLEMANLCSIAEMLYSSENNKKLGHSKQSELSVYFYKKTGFHPTKEQVRLMYQIEQYIKGNIFKKSPCVHIQAVAGASKSTCLKVVLDYLLEEGSINNDSYDVLAKTNTVASNFYGYNGKTIDGAINETVQYNIVGEDLEEVRNTVSISLLSGRILPKNLAIVDEHSMASPGQIELINLLYKKVIYMGDLNQLKQNNVGKGPCLFATNKSMRFLKSETTIQEEVIHLSSIGAHKQLLKRVEEVSEGSITSFLALNFLGQELQLRRRYDGTMESIREIVEENADNERVSIVTNSTSAVNELNKMANGGTLDILPGAKVRLLEPIHNFEGACRGTFWRVVSLLENGYAGIYNSKLGFAKQKVKNLALAFAVTTSSSEGLEWERGIYIYSAASVNAIPDIVTGITRFSKGVRVFTLQETDYTLLSALRVFATEGDASVLTRNTFYSLIQQSRLQGKSFEEIQVILNSLVDKVKEQEEANITPIDSLQIPAPTDKEASEATRNMIASKTKKFDIRDYRVKENTGEVKTAVWGVVRKKEGDHKWDYPVKEQYNKHRKHAEKNRDKLEEKGYEAFITRTLEGTNLVVVDFDDVKGFEQFIKWADLTEALVSPNRDSLHLVFTTDFLWKTSIGNNTHKVPVDFLGNYNHRLQNHKANKTPNGLKPMPLTSEFLDELNDYINANRKG